MPLTIYEASMPVFIRSLNNLSAILKKAENFADEKGIPHSKLLESRLAEDMAALPFQVQRCSDAAKFAAVRIFGVENIVMEDNETTFEQLQARITNTIEFAKRVDATMMDMEGKEDSEVVLTMGRAGSRQEIKFKAKDYLLKIVLPNFFFHVTTAYGILRANGVQIGKADYLGSLE